MLIKVAIYLPELLLLIIFINMIAILNTVFAEIFVIVLISDVTFIMKFKKLNNWRCTAQHAGLARLFRS